MHTAAGFISSWICVVELLLILAIVSISIHMIKNGLTKSRLGYMTIILVLISLFQVFVLGGYEHSIWEQLLDVIIWGGAGTVFLVASLAANPVKS